MSLQPGASAPDFALPDQHGRTTRLADLLGSGPVVLVFFPLAFSSTCQGELGTLRDHSDLFERAGAQLIGVSVDSKHTLRAWAEREGYAFPLLADFWPHGEIARAYGAFVAERGYAARATFVIDRGGVIRSSFATGPAEPRRLEQYRSALASLSA